MDDLKRRSQFAEPAEVWLRKHSAGKAIATKLFWDGLSKDHPELTTPRDGRKTPKGSCMRDLRKDPTFELGNGLVALRHATT